MRIIPLILLLACCLTNSCTLENRQNQSNMLIKSDSIKGLVVADTIIYDVLIKAEPDDLWHSKCVQKLQRRSLIDSLFNMVYTGRIVAYDHFSNEEISIKKLKKMEAKGEFVRADIGKIQFTERWLLDPVALTMDKEVLSIVLGYSYYGTSGDLRHTPVFSLKLK